MQQVYTKLVLKLVMLDLISRTQGQVYYTHTIGEVSKVTITSSRAWSKIYSSRQPSPGVTKWRHMTAHKWYGAPCGIKDDVWMQLYWYCVGSGIRIVQMHLIKHILSKLTIRGYCAFISYSEKPNTCCQCGGTAHVTKLSMHDCTTANNVSECKTNMGTTGSCGYSAQG